MVVLLQRYKLSLLDVSTKHHVYCCNQTTTIKYISYSLHLFMIFFQINAHPTDGKVESGLQFSTGSDLYPNPHLLAFEHLIEYFHRFFYPLAKHFAYHPKHEISGISNGIREERKREIKYTFLGSIWNLVQHLRVFWKTYLSGIFIRTTFFIVFRLSAIKLSALRQADEVKKFTSFLQHFS